METGYPIVRPLDLTAITLDKGDHSPTTDGTGGWCLMEAAAYMAGEPWTDHPKCVSSVLGSFGRNLNDLLPDDQRQQLRQYIPAMLGTADDGLDEARSYMALDWLIRTYTPAWLDLAGLTAEATALRDLRRIVDLVTAQEAGPIVCEAQTKAAAAWVAARDATWDAAWGAAWDAAGVAAGAAAWDAAGVAAGGAVWDAAHAAGVAAWGAAWDAAHAAVVAAGDGAREKLGATMDTLQRSAVELFVAMLRPAVTA